MSLQEAIDHWYALAEEYENAGRLGLTHPDVAKKQADTWRRAGRALEIQRDTGVAVCSCCFKPFGRGSQV